MDGTRGSAQTKYVVKAQPSWSRQFKALTVRNYKLKKRNSAETIQMIFMPVWFSLVLLILSLTGKKIEKDYSVSPLPPLTQSTSEICSPSALANCVHFGYTNTTSIDPILNQLNGFFSVSEPNQVITKRFATVDDMVGFYNNSPASLVIGVNFKNVSGSSIDYDIHANHSVFVNGFIDTRFTTIQSYLDRAMINIKRQSLNLPLLSSPLPSTSAQPGTSDSGIGRNFISTTFFVGQTPDFNINIYLNAYYLIFAFQPIWFNIINLVVQEKYKKIKPAMLTMGMSHSAYMGSIFLLHSILGLFTCILVMAICYAGRVFWYTNVFLVLVLLFLFSVSANAMGYIASIPFSDPKTSLFGSWIVTLTFMGGYAACEFTLFVSPDNTVAKETATYLISGIAFGRAISYITESEITLVGVTFANIQSTPLPRIYGMLIVDTILYGLIGWYLERLFPGEGSHPLPWNFFMRRSFWGSSKKTSDQVPLITQTKDNAFLHGATTAPNDMIELVDNDAIAPEDRGTIKIANLIKVFKSQGSGGLFRKPAETVALDSLSMELNRNEILSLLGHNGAGKTTAISVITGSILATSGTVVINGITLPTSREDSDNVRALELLYSDLGFCPQHDVLFTQLTAYESLEVFAAIKGVVVVSRKESANQVESKHELLRSYILDLLDDVYLKNKADNRIETFSGGMKRKLSVAIAFLGDPKIVLLDEPTTGMDVYSRKQIWQLMQDSKIGRTIILTTHSMEEADALGDRIAIISKGKLQTLGTSLYLKNRFGIGYHLNLEKLQDEGTKLNLFNEPKVTALVKEYFPDSTILSDTNYDITYVLPLLSSSKNLISEEAFTAEPDAIEYQSKPQNPSNQRLGTIDLSLSTSAFPRFFDVLNREMEAEGGLGVASVGLGLTTLEEVFLKLQKEQE